MVIYGQRQVGTIISVTVKPSEGEKLQVKISYQASRVIGESTESDAPLELAEINFSTETQMLLGEQRLLLARGESNRSLLLLAVVPE